MKHVESNSGVVPLKIISVVRVLFTRKYETYQGTADWSFRTNRMQTSDLPRKALLIPQKSPTALVPSTCSTTDRVEFLPEVE